MATVHVGECPVMTWTKRADGSVVVDQPWERFAVLDDDFVMSSDLVKSGWIARDNDPTREDQILSFRVSNGWARYRFIGNVGMSIYRSIWELIDGEYYP